jgi:hypothetical protein
MPLRLFREVCVLAVRISVAVAVRLTITTQANTQVAGTTLTCMQKDSSGTFIPSAQAVVTDESTGVARTVSPGGADLSPIDKRIEILLIGRSVLSFGLGDRGSARDKS